MEELVGVGGEADVCVGHAGGFAGVAVFVDDEVELRHRAKIWLQNVGDGHHVEQRRRLLAPLVIEDGQRVGQRSSLPEKERAHFFVELQLRRIEGHHENGNTAGEEFLRGGDVAINVVFRLRAAVGRVAEVAVAFADRAAHQHDAIEFLKCGGIATDRGAYVGEWTDGDKDDVARIFADLIEEEINGLRVGFHWSAFCPGGLRKRRFGWRRSAFGDWDIRSASFGEQAIDHLRTKFRVAPRAGDAEDLEFGTDQGEADREDIVDVVADVGVDDDLYRLSGRGLRLRARARRRRIFGT